MKLLTKELKNKIPPLYSQDGKGLEAIAYVKFFNPCGGETWYITEASATLLDESGNFFEIALKDILPDDDIIDIRMFGLITGSQFDELGYFSLNELQSIGLNPKMNLNTENNTITIRDLPIERDLYFESQPLKNFYKGI